MLKEGKDYGETFASTVSGDGLRWFCSIASTCGMLVKGSHRDICALLVTFDEMDAIG